MTLKALSPSSPVTMGLAGGIVVVAFWGGVLAGEFKAHMTNSQAADLAHETAIHQLDQRTDDHEVRLTAQERTVAAK